MLKLTSWKFSLSILAALIMMGPGMVALAQDHKTKDAQSTELSRLMLSYGQEAYERGLYEKAGYYFLQAVKINPTDMAFQWYQFSAAIKGEKKHRPVPPPEKIQPQPPAGKIPAEKIDPTKLGVTIGDDEGC